MPIDWWTRNPIRKSVYGYRIIYRRDGWSAKGTGVVCSAQKRKKFLFISYWVSVTGDWYPLVEEYKANQDIRLDFGVHIPKTKYIKMTDL